MPDADDDLAHFLDQTPRGDDAAAVRDHVTFRLAPGEVGSEATAALDAAADFVRWLKADAKAHGRRINARAHASYSGAVTARVPWQGERFHTVRFVALADGQLLARHNGAGGPVLSRQLHDWLTASARYGDPCWRTREEHQAGEAGQATPR